MSKVKGPWGRFGMLSLCVGFRVKRCGANAMSSRSTIDTQRNLTAIRDQNRVNKGRRFICDARTMHPSSLASNKR
jgi:hypothetical protein